MELSCAERLDSDDGELQTSQRTRTSPIALDDHFMNWDPRVLQNLLTLETSSVPGCDYFEHVQDDLQPFMRKVVTTWMLEVCEEQNCEEQVFPMSVCLMDRYLSARAITRTRLQLLACAALLVSSKLRQTNPLSVPLLCAYTDNSITPQDLMNWEMLLVQVLQWRVSSVTSFDFVELMLARTCRGPARALLRRHSHTLAALCYTETEFMRMKPSLMATACVVSAVRGLSVSEDALKLVETACSLTSTSLSTVDKIVEHIECLVARETAPQNQKNNSPPNSQPTTPTHVQDVIF